MAMTIGGTIGETGRMRRRDLVLGLPLVLGACAVLAPAPPKLYTLTPAQQFPADLPQVGWQLQVEPPMAPAALDTVRIPIATSPTALDYFANVSWTDRAPAMVQGLLVESFENSGRILSVSRDTAGLRADYVLKTEIRDFQAESVGGQSATPERVRVRLTAKLVSTQRRAIEAAQTFGAEAPVTGSAFSAVIAAFDEALRRVMMDAVVWTLRSGVASLGVRSGR